MKVFVIGGIGAIGQTAVSALVAAGHQVTALSCSAVKSDRLVRQGASPVRVSLFDRERHAQLFGDNTTSLTRSLRVSNRRFRAATGWSPAYPSVQEGWKATAIHVT